MGWRGRGGELVGLFFCLSRWFGVVYKMMSNVFMEAFFSG